MSTNNLKNYVGKAIYRETDAANGRITALVHSSCSPNHADLQFELTFDGEQFFVPARISALRRLQIRMVA
jgi:hypothetical protein